MKALYKPVGKPWHLVEIENTLKALQEAVGGYIETVTFAEDAALICDEEGRIKGKPFNTDFLGLPMVGNLLVVGVSGEEFTDIPEEARNFWEGKK